jgi:hypothetical protein
MERAPLFEDWKEFMTLLPEERIVAIYMDVNAISEYGEVAFALKKGSPRVTRNGDLVLTNKRLIHLEYRYKRRRSEKRVVAFLACLSLFLFSLFSPLLLFVSLPLLMISLFLLRGAPFPIGYCRMAFDVPLEKIREVLESSRFLEIEVAGRKRPILIGLKEFSPHEFKRNLSYLVYEAQHRPKEIVQYNVVTRFDLGKDGTVSVSCPYCGASAPLRSKESEVTCKYCGKQYIIPKKILDLIG